MDLDSPLVWEEAEWSSTPSGKQIPHACRSKMRLPSERPAEGCCFLETVQLAYTQLAALIHLNGRVQGLRLHRQRMAMGNMRQRKANVPRKWSDSSS